MTKKPNFLLIITDQHRADHLGCYGNAVVQTPNIDAIAQNGTTFDQFYVASPVCMPNRSVLMTGRMPSAIGTRTNGIPLPLDANTFVRVLRNGGYRTALIGKSHLQNMAPRPVPSDNFVSAADEEATFTPIAGPDYEMELINRWREDPGRDIATPYYGFDLVRLACGHGDRVVAHYADWARAKCADFEKWVGPENALARDGYDFFPAWRTAMPEELYPTTFVADTVVDYLKDFAATGGENPFFVQCSFPDPHHPFTPPGKYWNMYDPGDCPPPASAFADLIDAPPLAVRLRAEAATPDIRQRYPTAAYGVASERELRETLALTYGMITMIDDGVGRILAALRELGLEDDTVIVFTSDHGDLMGDHGLMLKHCFHNQGLIRVPFIWSEHGATGARRTDRLCGTLDIAQTILARAGLEPYNGMQGRDVFAETDTARPAMLIEEDEIDASSNCGPYTRTRSIVTGRWRMTLWLEQGFGELYDRDNDPDEIVNLWNDPAAAVDKADLIATMLDERLKLDDLSPRQKYVA